MTKKLFQMLCLLMFLIALAASLVRAQNEVTLDVLQFPERDTTRIPMIPSFRVSDAQAEAEIRFEKAQMQVTIAYKNLKPAVLFAGDVTCYVLWAVGRDGSTENLGEVWARPEKNEDKIVFSTGQKIFGLLVTAESYYLTPQPSSLIILQSGQREKNPLRSTQVTLTSFAPSPNVGLERLANVRYDGKTPLDIVQAQKVMEIAGAAGAEKYAASMYREATVALQQAMTASAGGARKGAQEYARRSVAASNDAIRISKRAIEAEELEARIAKRQAEMEALEKRASSAEAQAREYEAAISSLQKQQADNEAALSTSRQELEKVADERKKLDSAVRALQQEQQSLQASLVKMREQNVKLETSLQGALAQIADTRQSAEGIIVNLPDILFEINKADLKPELKLVLAKLAGVVLVMPDLQLQIEGHTDSTGAASRNLELSQQRANSVFDFMAENGIASTRMTAVGYGQDRPVADNATSEGRQKNRRVEILVKGAGSNQ